VSAVPPPRARYRWIAHLGTGGSADVFLVRDELLEVERALKVLIAGPGGPAADRLLAEARLAARLVHPNVVAVHDLVQIDDRLWGAFAFGGHSLIR